jgi:hypothetical protein
MAQKDGAAETPPPSPLSGMVIVNEQRFAVLIFQERRLNQARNELIQKDMELDALREELEKQRAHTRELMQGRRWDERQEIYLAKVVHEDGRVSHIGDDEAMFCVVVPRRAFDAVNAGKAKVEVRVHE